MGDKPKSNIQTAIPQSYVTIDRPPYSPSAAQNKALPNPGQYRSLSLGMVNPKRIYAGTARANKAATTDAPE